MWHSVLHSANTALGRGDKHQAGAEAHHASRTHQTKAGQCSRQWVCGRTNGQRAQCKDRALCSAVLACLHSEGQDLEVGIQNVHKGRIKQDRA